jgi:hypothetical protein
MTTSVNAVTNVAQESSVVVINLAVSAMSADRQVDLAEIGISFDDLPKASKKLVEEKIFPADFLRKYMHIREKAFAEMLKDGAVQIPMGIVASKTAAVEKYRALKAFQQEWDECLEADSLTYEAMCRDHIMDISSQALEDGTFSTKIQALAELLLKRQPSWEQVRSRMSFAFTLTPVSLDEADFDADLYEAQRDSIVALREGVMGGLIQYVCKEANELLKVILKRNAGRTEYSLNGRTAARVAAISGKLHSLAFVHKMVRPLAEAVDQAVEDVPASNAGRDVVLTSVIYNNLVQCLTAMSDQITVVDRLEKKLPFVTVSQATQVASPAAQAVVPAQTTSAPQTVAAQPALALGSVDEEDDATTEAPADVDGESAEEVTPVASTAPAAEAPVVKTATKANLMFL